MISELENGTILQVPLDNSGYTEPIRQHHVIETTWNVVDIWNAVCLKHFKPSYLLYHQTEQSMEQLFTEEIRKMW